jgi:hypothetical protein
MPKELNDIMDFDHVVEVREDGSIIDRNDIFAPSLFDDELDTEGWTLLDGFSGQDRYSGPIMHASEFIGGGMEDYIRQTPGVYVALVAYCSPDEDDEDTGENPVSGWAVAYQSAP